MPPAITVTPAARAKIEAVRSKSGHPDARLRIAIAGRRGGQFVYELDLVAPEDAPVADIMIETEGLHAVGFAESDFRKHVEATTPLGRIGQPEDIATAAVFLASGDAGWITGQTLIAAGGARQ